MLQPASSPPRPALPAAPRYPVHVRLLLATLVVASLLGVVSAKQGEAATETTVASRSIGLPAYFYPAGAGLAYWDQLRSGAPTVGVIIATGLRLEATVADTNYQSQIARTRAAGIKVLAYVTTSGGDRPAAAVKSEIDRAFAWYNVDGIFFDEAVRYPVTCDQVDYYRSLSQYAKAKKAGATTVVNHGQILPECYASVSDVLMNAEMGASDYRSSWRPWGWEHKYPATKFWHLVHSTATVTEMQEMLKLSRSRNAARVFVTSATLTSPGGPYGSLPAKDYWTAQLRAVAAETPVTTSTTKAPTTSTTKAPTTSTTKAPTTTTTRPAVTSTTTMLAPIAGTAPSISGFSPIAGPPGSVVTLFGTGLDGVNTVTLDGGPVTIVGRTATTLIVVLSPWSTSGSFWVSAPSGLSATSGQRFTVLR